jgi:beta-xylosidase
MPHPMGRIGGLLIKVPRFGGKICSKITASGWWCNHHLEKYEFVNGKDDIPYMKWIEMENLTCLKPPTSHP